MTDPTAIADPLERQENRMQLWLAFNPDRGGFIEWRVLDGHGIPLVEGRMAATADDPFAWRHAFVDAHNALQMELAREATPQ